MTNYFEIAIEIRSENDQHNFQKAFNDIRELVKRIVRNPDLESYLCPIEDDEPWVIYNKKEDCVKFFTEDSCVISQEDADEYGTIIYNFTKRYPTPDEIIYAVMAIFYHYFPATARGSQTYLDEFGSGLQIAKAINPAINAPAKLYSFDDYEFCLKFEKSELKPRSQCSTKEKIEYDNKLSALVILKEFFNLTYFTTISEKIKQQIELHAADLMFSDSLNLNSDIKVEIQINIPTEPQKKAYQEAYKDILLLSEKIVASNNRVKYCSPNGLNNLWINIADNKQHIKFQSTTSEVIDLLAVDNTDAVSITIKITTLLQQYIMHAIIALFYHHLPNAIIDSDSFSFRGDGLLAGLLIAKNINSSVEGPEVYYFLNSDYEDNSDSLSRDIKDHCAWVCEVLAHSENKSESESSELSQDSNSNSGSESESSPPPKRYKTM